MTFCTKCGYARIGDDGYCGKCGNKFADMDASVNGQPFQAEKANFSRICAKGHENRGRIKFCSVCDSPISLGPAHLSSAQRDWRAEFSEVMESYESTESSWRDRCDTVIPLTRRLRNMIGLRGYDQDVIESQGVEGNVNILAVVIELSQLNLNQAMQALDLAVEGRTSLLYAAEALRASDGDAALAWNTIVDWGLAKTFEWPQAVPPEVSPCIKGHLNTLALFCAECGSPIPFPDDGYRIDLSTRSANLRYVEAVIEKTKQYERIPEKEKSTADYKIKEMEVYVKSKGIDYSASLSAGCFGGVETFGHHMWPHQILRIYNMDVYAFMRSFDLAVNWECQLFWTAVYMTRNEGDEVLAWNELIKDGYIGSANWADIDESNLEST